MRWSVAGQAAVVVIIIAVLLSIVAKRAKRWLQRVQDEREEERLFKEATARYNEYFAGDYIADRKQYAPQDSSPVTRIVPEAGVSSTPRFPKLPKLAGESSDKDAEQVRE